MAETPIFAATPHDALTELADRGRTRTFAKGTYLFHQGDDALEILFLFEGNVEISSYSPGGQRVLRTTARSPHFLGELGVFGEIPRTASGLAIDDCKVWVCDGKTMMDFLVDRPEASRGFIRALARQVAEYGGIVDDLLFLDLKGRVAKRFISLAGDGESIPAMTQSDLASLVGGSRENVNRIVSELTKRGYIGRQGKRYVINNRDGLEKLAGL